VLFVRASSSPGRRPDLTRAASTPLRRARRGHDHFGRQDPANPESLVFSVEPHDAGVLEEGDLCLYLHAPREALRAPWRTARPSRRPASCPRTRSRSPASRVARPEPPSRRLVPRPAASVGALDLHSRAWPLRAGRDRATWAYLRRSGTSCTPLRGALPIVANIHAPVGPMLPRPRGAASRRCRAPRRRRARDVALPRETPPGEGPSSRRRGTSRRRGRWERSGPLR
jgi:hypothetical protein